MFNSVSTEGMQLFCILSLFNAEESLPFLFCMPSTAGKTELSCMMSHNLEWTVSFILFFCPLCFLLGRNYSKGLIKLRFTLLKDYLWKALFTVHHIRRHRESENFLLWCKDWSLGTRGESWSLVHISPSIFHLMVSTFDNNFLNQLLGLVK